MHLGTVQFNRVEKVGPPGLGGLFAVLERLVRPWSTLQQWFIDLHAGVSRRLICISDVRERLVLIVFASLARWTNTESEPAGAARGCWHNDDRIRNTASDSSWLLSRFVCYAVSARGGARKYGGGDEQPHACRSCSPQLAGMTRRHQASGEPAAPTQAPPRRNGGQRLWRCAGCKILLAATEDVLQASGHGIVYRSTRTCRMPGALKVADEHPVYIQPEARARSQRWRQIPIAQISDQVRHFSKWQHATPFARACAPGGPVEEAARGCLAWPLLRHREVAGTRSEALPRPLDFAGVPLPFTNWQRLSRHTGIHCPCLVEGTTWKAEMVSAVCGPLHAVPMEGPRALGCAGRDGSPLLGGINRRWKDPSEGSFVNGLVPARVVWNKGATSTPKLGAGEFTPNIQSQSYPVCAHLRLTQLPRLPSRRCF